MQTKLLNKAILAVFPAVILAVLWVSLDMAQERVLAGDYGIIIYSDTLLDNDITGSVAIAANNIILDCNGHTITGSGTGEDPAPTWGIHLYQKDGVMIKNCNITNFTFGIGVSYSNNIILSNNNLFANKYGIRLWNSSNNTITDNKVAENLIGVDLRGSSLNTISNNEVSLNRGDGILLRSYSNKNVVSTNNIINNKGNGISLFWQGRDQIIKNKIDSNSDHGIYFYFARGNVITENTISNNQYDLSFLSQSWDNILYHNNFINNGKSSEYDRWEISNIYDDGYPSGGNYWSDYQGDDNFSGHYQDQSGKDGIGDHPYYPFNVSPQPGWYNYISGRDRYPFMRENGWKTQPDFSIEAIKPVQVVWDSDINEDGKIDLVAGKSTMVRVEIGMENYEALDPSTPVEITLFLPDPSGDFTIPKFFYPTIEQLLALNKQLDVYLDFDLPFGDHTITAEIDPMNEIEESDLSNNHDYVGITIKDTNSLFLVNFPVEDCDGHTPNLGFYQTTVAEGGKFILGTYPVAIDEFTNRPSPEKIKAGPSFTGFLSDKKCLTHKDGQIATLLSLWQARKLTTNGQADIAVGIVPRGSLGTDTHGIAFATPDILNVSIPSLPAVLVEENYWTVTAHEVGHIYKLWNLKEEYDAYPSGDPLMLSGRKSEGGIWVDKEYEIFPGTTLCFMGEPHIWAYNDWDSAILTEKKPNEFVNSWIDREDYEHLFRKFRVNKTDPELLLVSGVISKDGSIELSKSYLLPNGIADEAGQEGGYTIILLNSDGKIISEIAFDVVFKMHSDPIGIVDTDIAPFGFAIPFPERTASIEIHHEGQILAEFNPSIKLLHDAVDLVPAYGFIKNPKEYRNTLHNKINAVEKMLEENNNKGALQKLEHDIKDKIKKWILDDFSTENPLQFTKNGLLELIDEIIERVNLIN